MNTLLTESAEQIKKAWAHCITSQNSDELMRLYSKNAILKPTLSTVIRNGHDEILPYFIGSPKFNDSGFLNQGISEVKFLKSNQYALDSVVVDVGTYEFTKSNGESTFADYTFVFDLSNLESVSIVAHHSSLVFSETV